MKSYVLVPFLWAGCILFSFFVKPIKQSRIIAYQNIHTFFLLMKTSESIGHYALTIVSGFIYDGPVFICFEMHNDK